eukprot:CAMPEP_0170572518 /NCGR_PEP_ID=MMETSP0224-20130122/2258_1 /TAXON_ID=285029 /ORGANISM="Togula jolla, Strain CCCM 725" /LENGTH=34 /DNA_ID= /DNA_START= /DNA_END= /DNA_ORIENTATION=
MTSIGIAGKAESLDRRLNERRVIEEKRELAMHDG